MDFVKSGATLGLWADVLWKVGIDAREIVGQMLRGILSVLVAVLENVSSRGECRRPAMNRGKPPYHPSPLFPFFSFGSIVAFVGVVGLSPLLSTSCFLSLCFAGLNISFDILRWLARQSNTNCGGVVFSVENAGLSRRRVCSSSVRILRAAGLVIQ